MKYSGVKEHNVCNSNSSGKKSVCVYRQKEKDNANLAKC